MTRSATSVRAGRPLRVIRFGFWLMLKVEVLCSESISMLTAVSATTDTVPAVSRAGNWM
jgi:hypothetical protein